MGQIVKPSATLRAKIPESAFSQPKHFLGLEFMRNRFLMKLLRIDYCQVRLLGVELSEKPIGVLIAATLP